MIFARGYKREYFYVFIEPERERECTHANNANLQKERRKHEVLSE